MSPPTSNDLQKLILEQKTQADIYQFFEHEIKYISFGCPSSNYFGGFMTVSLVICLRTLYCGLLQVASHVFYMALEKLCEAFASQSSDLNTCD